MTTPACLEFLEKNNWEDRKELCRKQLKEFYPIVSKELGSAPICPLTDEFLGQICSIPIKTSDPVKLKEVLYDKYNIEIPVIANAGPTVFLRISFQAYNDEKEIETLINAIRDIKSTTNLLE